MSRCRHDFNKEIRKGRALYVCPKCGADISLALNGYDGKVALAELTTQRDSYERALKVIHVWAKTPGCLLPENVLRLTSKTLGIKP